MVLQMKKVFPCRLKLLLPIFALESIAQGQIFTCRSNHQSGPCVESAKDRGEVDNTLIRNVFNRFSASKVCATVIQVLLANFVKLNSKLRRI